MNSPANIPHRGATSPAPQGFTLFEMMIVLVILAMTMTVAPSIMAGLAGSRLRSASDNLIAQLRETRSQALRRGVPTEFAFDLAKRTYATATAPGFRPLPSVVDAVDVKPPALLQPDGIARIRFGSDGTATEARISLRHAGSSVGITVDWLTGRVHPGG
jgi:prepilin-type N-terminal cleavage/methylation domain-containing protein